jgi:hypothetical protein
MLVTPDAASQPPSATHCKEQPRWFGVSFFTLLCCLLVIMVTICCDEEWMMNLQII